MRAELFFLLSPAFCGGKRSQVLLRHPSEVPIARRLGAGELTLGEAFAFLSGLYFRGKLAYAQSFGYLRDGNVSTLVITPSRGLMDPGTLIDAALIREFAEVDVAIDNATYRTPLDRDAETLSRRLPEHASVVLLGSIASGKYVDILAPRLTVRLRYPSAFVGRGDMSRGGLLLRSVSAGHELAYEAVTLGERIRGRRPPRLERLPRSVQPRNAPTTGRSRHARTGQEQER